ncbi:MAG: Crp/Fnr family transcriptional regulator [Alphaproteobacteria bacterium PA4]|nr:MAG: Crp/Fnr family transcriptional regulator [Alphaproteobacteria bacterium PA4]
MTQPETRVCSDCAVRGQALCGVLDDAELVAFNRIGQRRRLAAGETLIWAGDDSRLCGNVLSGLLKLSAATSDGREQTVGLLYPADFLGQPFAGQTGFTLTALTDVTLCVFPRRPFEALLAAHPRLERVLLERTFAALEDARSRMLMLARLSATERVASFLIDMADRSRRCDARAAEAQSFELPLSRAQIGDLLGLTIETVSRQLTGLKRRGVIALPGLRGVTIRDRAALAGLAEAA